MSDNKASLLEMTVEVVRAFAGHNSIPADQLPQLIRSVHQSFQELAQQESEDVKAAEPAVAIRKSIRPDAIVCLECGTEHKMIKRHLKTAHEMSVEDYREKWSLRPDYPVVAPNYARQRSQLAKQFGLGKKTG